MSSKPGAISSTPKTRPVIDLISDLDWKTAKVCDVGAGRGHFSHSLGEKLRTEHGLEPAEHVYPCDLIPDTFEYDAEGRNNFLRVRAARGSPGDIVYEEGVEEGREIALSARIIRTAVRFRDRMLARTLASDGAEVTNAAP